MIKITSKKEGFRRCGVSHPKGATEYPDDRFSTKELKILEGEPMLFVEFGVVDEKAEAEAKAKAEAEAKAKAEADAKAKAEADAKAKAKKAKRKK